MTPLDRQLEALKARFPGCTAQPLPDGSTLVRLPDIPLPPGWSRPTTTVMFVVSPAYPHAQPDCFFADPDLRLANGTMPQNSGFNPIPGWTQAPPLWFSWHLTTPWNSNQDTLMTWVGVIRNRLKEAR